MRNLSSKFRHEMYYNHTFDCLAEITLVNNTKLTLTNTELWMGGFTQDDSVSQDNSFTALGAAVIGSASIIINNMDESYSDYDFTNAKVVLSLSKTYSYNGSDVVEPIRMGTYSVDDTAYNGATITLSLLDNMAQFDRPYTTNLSYPATLIDIVEDACLKCGVQLATLTFPHENYEVQTKPDKDNTTYRQVLSWAAAIAGCFARCNAEGKLELKWFDTSLIDSHSEGLDGGEFDASKPYSTGDTANGGSFNPWNTGYEIDDGSFETVRQLHYLTRLSSQNIGVDDVVITGVKVITEVVNSTTNQREDKTYLAGTEDYVIELSGNAFITSDTANSVCTWLGNQLIGLRFRNGSVTHINDPSIEAGDVAIVVDRKGREYPFLITRTSFSASGNQTTECNAESASRNSATRFSQATKAYVDARKLLNKEQTTREQAIQDLVNGLASKSGLYSTVETTQSGNIYYLHDKPLLADSKIVWKMTSNAFGVTTNYNGEHPEQTSWNAGLTVDGALIASIIDTIKINFDRGTGGTLTLGGDNNVNGLLRMLDANGNEVGRWSNSGIDILKGSIEIPYSWTSTWGATYTSRTQMINRGVALIETSNQNDITVAKLGGLIQDTLYPYHDYPNNLLEIYSKIVRYSNRITECSFDILSGRLTVYFNDDESSGEFYASGGYIFAKGTNSFEDSSISNCSFTYRGNVLQVIRTDSLNQLKTRFRVYLGEDSSYSEVLMDAQLLCTENATFRKNVTVDGNLSVTGTKNRLVKTTDYSERYLYCYETTTPVFGDIGEGVIGEDGKIYIQLDPIFLETITTENYQVFIQLYDDGKAYVSERHKSYFVVTGTPNIAFGWEVKAKQSNYENYRLEDRRDIVDITGKDYCDLAVTHIKDIMKERGITNESSNISNSME